MSNRRLTTTPDRRIFVLGSGPARSRDAGPSTGGQLLSGFSSLRHSTPWRISIRLPGTGSRIANMLPARITGRSIVINNERWAVSEKPAYLWGYLAGSKPFEAGEISPRGIGMRLVGLCWWGEQL